MIIISIIYSYSKHHNNQGVFYKNVKSITTSLKAKKIEMEVTDVEVANMGAQIKLTELSANVDDFVYCGLFHKIYIVRYVFNRTNVLFYRMANHTVNECEVYANGLGKKIVYIQ